MGAEYAGVLLEDRIEQVHDDGTSRSQALWDIRHRYLRLGLTTRDWDRTLTSSQLWRLPGGYRLRTVR